MDTTDDAAACSKTCPECGRVFTKAAHLLRHRLVHDQQKPYSCSVCQKPFARPDALQRHVRTVHANKRRRSEDDDGGSHDESGPSRERLEVHDAAPLDTNGTNEEPSEGVAMSPSTMFAAMGAELEAASPRIPADPTDATPFAVPFGTSFGTPLGVPISSSGSLHTLFPSSFLGAFGTGSAPSSSDNLDEMIAGWLNQDGAAQATENALAAAFSDQQHMMDYMSTGSIGVESSHQTQDPYIRTAERPRSSDAFFAQSRSQSSHETFSAAFGSNAPGYSPLRSNTTARSRRQVMNADTWESGMSNPQQQEYTSGTVSRADSPQPRVIRSPEEVVAALNVNPVATPPTTGRRDSVIPSMKFLEACLHLYFRDFHPFYPIIHRATFERDRTPPLLLLSMCSIGCMFVGTQAARDSGLWIYERLHYVIVVTRDAKMATEESRVTVMLSALLGQCFSFLYGQPKQMLTAESFHGSLSTKARRTGLGKRLKRNPITYDQVDGLEPGRLKKRWREWGQQETLRRLTLGLTIHAAEATIYSGLARLVIAQVSDTDQFSDALFEADDAESWRSLLLHAERGTSRPPCATPEVFLPTAILAQTVVNINKMRELDDTPFASELSIGRLHLFYTYMLSFAEDYAILPVLERPRDDAAPHRRSLAALWHYNCVIRLTPMDLIGEAAGRGGSPARESIADIQEWVATPAARLAAVHCGHILYQAADLQDLGFLIPRIIFQATLVLFCYLSFSPTSVDKETVDVVQCVVWQRLAQLSDTISGDGDLDDAERFTLQEFPTPLERLIARGTSAIQVPGFFDGKERMLDVVSLRSRSNRLLRRCTPWGIGEALSDILSTVCF